MESLPFNYNDGFAGLISWLAMTTDGYFFIIILITIAAVVFPTMLVRYEFDLAFFATTTGLLIFGILLFLMGGLEEGVIYMLAVLFTLSLIKIALFKN